MLHLVYIMQVAQMNVINSCVMRTPAFEKRAYAAYRLLVESNLYGIYVLLYTSRDEQMVCTMEPICTIFNKIVLLQDLRRDGDCDVSSGI